MEALPESEEEAQSSEEEESEESEESEDEEEMENSRMKIPKSGNKLNAAGPSQGKANEESDEEDEDEEEEDSDSDEQLAGRMQRGAGISTPGSDEPDRTRILSVLELEDLFLKQAPEGAFPFLLPALRRTDLLLPSFGRVWSRKREDGRWTRRVPQRWKVVDHQRPHRREEGLGLVDARKDEALPNHPPLPRRPTL